MKDRPLSSIPRPSGLDSRERQERNDNLVQYLRAHGFKNLSSLSIDVVLVTHAARTDGEKAASIMQGADVAVIEAPGLPPRTLIHLRDASKGMVPFNDKLVSEFQRGLFPRLAASGAAIAVADLAYRSIEVKRLRKALKKLMRFLGTLAHRKPTLSLACSMFANRLRQFALLNRERDLYITRHIGSAIASACYDNADLLNKESLSVAVYYGASHTAIVHQLRQMNPSTTMWVADGEIVFSLEDEAMRRWSMGFAVDPGLIEKALVAAIVRYSGIVPDRRLPNHWTIYNRAIRDVLNGISGEDCKNIYTAFLRGRGEAHDAFLAAVKKSRERSENINQVD